MAQLHIVCEGDSLTVGLNLAATSRSTYPFQLALLYTDNRMVAVYNDAVSAQTIDDMDAQTSVTATYDSRKGNQVLVVWAGTNDIYFGATGAATYALLAAYCAARRAVGFKVVVLTCLPRSNAGTPAGFNTDRATLNTSIRANWATFADALADVAADSRIGDDGDELDTTYFDADKVHMNATGYGVIASIVKTAIGTIVP
jgi:lysophospholipase L1-like esterase